jgi:hypothetical protein
MIARTTKLGKAMQARSFAFALALIATVASQCWAQDPEYGGMDSHCVQNSNVDLRDSFATCNPSGGNWNFKSIVLAVHGWGGDCRATFGEGNETLFHFLQQAGHYDLDCFNYESKEWPIAVVAEHLKNRIRFLESKGYRNFVIVTHSLGGIAFLDVLAESYLADDGKSLRAESDSRRIFTSKGARLKFASIWASPIKGVRPDIATSAKWAKIFGILKEDTVAAISERSEYLASLRNRLKLLGQAWNSATSEQINGAELSLTFHQGQGDDWVVHKIDGDEDWLVALGREHAVLSRSDGGHSDTVGNPGEPHAPRYPAYIVNLETLLALPFAVRLQDVFPEGAAIEPSYEGRQLKVVTGANAFISHANLFQGAREEIAGMFKHFLKPRGNRFASVDKKFIDDLLKGVEQRAAALNNDDDKAAYLQLAGVFICSGSAEAIDLTKSGNEYPGKGSDVVGERILAFYERLMTKTRALITAEPALRNYLLGCASLEEAEAKYAALNSSAQFSQHKSQREAALRNLESFVTEASDIAVSRSNVVAELGNYLKVGGASEAYAVRVANTLEKASLRSPVLQAQVAATVSEPLPNGQPVYSRGFSEAQISRIAASAEKYIAFPANRDFLQDVWVSAGAKGNDTAVSRTAFDVLLERAQTTASTQERAIIMEGLNPSLIEDRYPGLASEFEQKLAPFR